MNKKDNILHSVLKLVNREGFYHLNIKKIATEAGVAAGTIYLYFKGKEDLINALYEYALTAFNKDILQHFDEDASVKQNFDHMMQAALAFYIQRPDYFSFIEQYTYAPFLFKEVQDQNFLLLRPIYKLFRQGKKEKIIRDIPDEILISIVHGALSTITKLHLAKKYDLHQKKNQKLFCDAVWASVALSEHHDRKLRSVRAHRKI